MTQDAWAGLCVLAALGTRSGALVGHICHGCALVLSLFGAIQPHSKLSMLLDEYAGVQVYSVNTVARAQA